MFRFHCLGVPVQVEWWFWLTCFLLSGNHNPNSQRELVLLFIWAGVVFVSVLVHEMGHALTGRKHGATPAVRLHGLGGVCYNHGGWFSRWQHIQVIAAGPGFGLVLGFFLWLVQKSGIIHEDYGYAHAALRMALWVNIGWSLFNLLPVQPMDGGQLLREALGPGRRKITSTIGLIVALCVAYWALDHRQYFLLIMFLYLAYVNFQDEPVEGGVVHTR